MFGVRLLKDFGVGVSIRRKIRNYCATNRIKYRNRNYNNHSSLGEPVSVFIPVLEKDLTILPLVIESLRRHVKHNIQSICLISPVSDKINRFAKEFSVELLYEDGLVPIIKKDIKYVVNDIDRSGWLYQQLLKINAIATSKTQKVLICDADTLFIRDQVFFDNKYIYFDISKENHIPYKNAYRELTGLPAVNYFSFVSHHILIEKRDVSALIDIIEKKCNTSWYEAIISLANPNEASCFSEYDTLGNIALSLHPESVCLRYWDNCSLSRRSLAKNKNRLLPLFYRSLSFHDYME